MGWKKLVTVTLLFFLFNSCKNYFHNSYGGVRPKKSKFNLSKFRLKKEHHIDTNAVYVADIQITYDGKEDKFKRFYRFFTNGQVLEGTSGLFSDELTLNRVNDFNNSGSNVGYYTVVGNKIKIETFRTKKNEGGFYSLREGFIDNDNNIFIVDYSKESKKETTKPIKSYIFYKKEKIQGLKGNPDW